MSAPKSVTRIKNGNVEYISNVDACEYYIFELCRGALRDVSKLVKKKYTEAYYQHYKKDSGYGGKNIRAKIKSSKSTRYPNVAFRVFHTKKGEEDKGYYAFFQATGAKNENKPKWKLDGLNLIGDVIQSNASTIRQIEAQYLSAINGDEASMQAKINESEVDE